MSTITLPHLWNPRQYQLEALQAFDLGILREFLVWHRRAGKDVYGLNKTAKAGHDTIGSYYHMLPTARQARKVVWLGINKEGKRHIDQAFPAELRKRTLDDEMLIEFKNGTIWQCVGSDGYDALVGTNPRGIVFSEWSLSDPRAWDYMRPILAENGGWSTFIGTPRGKNFFYDQYKMAMTNPKWFCSLRTVDDTKAIPMSVIDEERASGMAEPRIQQEYFCSFEAINIGSIYSSLVEKMQAEGKVGTILYDPRYPVETAWDIGHRDATAIFFIQRIGKRISVIDYIEERGKDLPYFAKELHKKPYNYSRHIWPHDGKEHEWGAGTTRTELGRQHGLNVVIAPKLSVETGIEAVRAILPRMEIDSHRCMRVVQALKQYAYEEDEEKATVGAKPAHDWSSHCCDALRYFAVTPEGFGLIPDWARENKGGYNHNGGPPLDDAPFDPLAEWKTRY